MSKKTFNNSNNKNIWPFFSKAPNFSRFIVVFLTLLALSLVASFLYFPKDKDNMGIIIGLTLLILSFLIFWFGEKEKSKSVILILVSLASVIIGGLNDGLFGIGAGALFWPIYAAWAIKAPRILAISANLITFLAILFFGLISGKVPTFENPILPSLLSLGLSAFFLNLLFNFSTLPFFQKLALEKIESAKSEAEIAKTQTKARTLFIAEMSHEIRTPLNHILGFSEMMNEEVFGPLNLQYKEYAGLIHQSGKHLSDLVGDILDMSKIEAGKYKIEFETFDLSSLAKETMQLAKGNAYNAGLKLNFFGNNVCKVNADKRAMKQIILNLLSNSIKYTPKEGNISLRVFGNSSKIWLEVSDTGRGMSANEIAKIGEPYMNAQSNDGTYRSTGLGLALVKKLTELQNGNFGITSQSAKGTNVILEFDAAT